MARKVTGLQFSMNWDGSVFEKRFCQGKQNQDKSVHVRR